MRDSFVSAAFTLDLRNIKVTYVDQSPRFKDSFFTKYSFPFDFKMDRDLKVQMGNYTALEAVNLKSKHKGYHVFEGKINAAVLEILEVNGETVRAQIDSGFDELPNFEKKLSELPLEKFNVSNIYTHAESICKKKYPEVNYNFPRVIYDKHSEDETGWEYFNKFINDRREEHFVNNNELSQDGPGTYHVNRNIIQPMPYLLYLLKTGFQDAGFQLQGEILEDEDLKQRVVFSNKDYYSQSKDSPIEINIQGEEFTGVVKEEVLRYKKEFDVEKKGKYLFQGNVSLKPGYDFVDLLYSIGSQIRLIPAKIKVFCNDVKVYEKIIYKKEYLDINLAFENNKENGKVKIEIETQKSETVLISSLGLRKYFDESGNSIFNIINLNEVNLKLAVPDLTFGELVTIVKNWKNYDLEVVDGKIIMNKLKPSSINKLTDISSFVVDEPTKTFTKKRSYHISFTDMDDEKDNLDSCYIDEEGIKINGVQKEETNEIKINGYCLPIESFNGIRTAAIKKDDNSILSLIYYDGLYNNDNLAQNPPGLAFPELLLTFEEWYKMRINSTEYRWSFIVNKNRFRHIGMRDTMYGYKRKLWIKDITKNVLNERFYKIDIVTEVVG